MQMNQPPDMTKKQKLWTRDFILICAATFLIFCGFQILMPTLPKYAATLGADKKMIGLINGIFTIAAVSFRPFIGRELDLRGRKGIYLGGLALFFLAVLGYIWVPTLFLLLALRLVHGLGWAASSTAAGTIVADIIPPSRRGEGMGYYGLFSTLAMAIAPALGLTLIPNYGFSFIATLSLILTAGAFLAGYAIQLETRKNQGLDSRPPGGKPSVFDKRALKVSLVMLFMTLSYGGVVTFLPLYAEERGIANIGPFFTIYALSLMVTRPVAGKYYDRKGPNHVILFGLLSIFFSTVLLSQASALPLFLISGILYGLGFGSIQPTLLALAIQGIEPQRRGAVNGTVMSAFDLGIGVGSLSLGLIANALGYSYMYLISSVTALIGLAIFFFWPKPAATG
jgi:MFS family permease